MLHDTFCDPLLHDVWNLSPVTGHSQPVSARPAGPRLITLRASVQPVSVTEMFVTSKTAPLGVCAMNGEQVPVGGLGFGETPLGMLQATRCEPEVQEV
jgi:hypothetical protein